MSAPQRTGVYFFSNDLRIHDNPTLKLASESVDKLLCVFCYEPWWQQANQQSLISLGEHRAKFLQQSLESLSQKLADLGQNLVVIERSPAGFLSELSPQKHPRAMNIDVVFRCSNAGVYERRQWQALQNEFPHIEFVSAPSETLFSEAQLPCSLAELPETFTQFRKLVEQSIEPIPPIASASNLPPSPLSTEYPSHTKSSHNAPLLGYEFIGGETAALKHMSDYFSGRLPSRYKEVRNALDGWDNSTKFSPWLANGSLSVRTLYAQLKTFESQVVKNSSTYWIYFELLWREYFHWYLRLHDKKAFQFGGIKGKKLLNSFYPERFKKWCAGNTPYPIVNACMNELNATGFLSNRGRQIAASCLINELQLDWRYGAAYFEQQLIDYDVASNWGNWQYLAGIGADARDKRHFNLEKQTEMFDPDGDYREKWGAADVVAPLDSVDAADWPIDHA